jgi:hypothetical protein
VGISAVVLSACTPSKTSSNKHSLQSQLDQFRSNVNSGENDTYGAEWSYVTSSGQSETVAYSQTPPKTMLKVNDALFIHTGSVSYFCPTSARCIAEGTLNPLASVNELFNGHTLLSEISAWTSQSSWTTAGITLTFTSATYAGVPSTCVNIARSSGTEVWCASNDTGLLTYWVAGGTYFTLTHYTSNPPSSNYQTPAGAQIVSL